MSHGIQVQSALETDSSPSLSIETKGTKGHYMTAVAQAKQPGFVFQPPLFLSFGIKILDLIIWSLHKSNTQVCA